MPSSRQLIASQVLGSSATSVTFSSIPGTYKDLVLRASVRLYIGDATQEQFFNVYFNSSGTTDFSSTYLRGYTTAQSFRSSSRANLNYNNTLADGATADTFSSQEIYIPNYAGSASKPVSSSMAAIQNSTSSQSSVYAGLYNSSSAISSITLVGPSGSYTFVTGSSFYLYGLSS
jgi:hypothetical protein